ncbi:MAG: hypothetical protein KDD33_08715 [Bdellovibrionales bacterium]|nr:hypothetical protein [Bdellovibrionales bacterium]
MRKIIVFLLIVSSALSCSKDETTNSATDSDSMVQQIGDTMASVDGSGGGDGGYALFAREAKTYARLQKQLPFAAKAYRSLSNTFMPKADATACRLVNTFGSCTNNQIVRDFQSCTIGQATFEGTVTIDFNDTAVDNTCAIASDGHTITRSPDFTITGPLGGEYAVSKTGSVGQRLTRTSAGVFDFTNDGIRRTLTFRSATRADFTTVTTSAIGVTGNNRSGRVMDGGTLRVTNNLNSATCDYSPSSVTWDTTCNCAISGSWALSCSDSTTGTYAITGCGTGTLTIGSDSESVTLDQCTTL